MNLRERLVDYAWIGRAQLRALGPSDPLRWATGEQRPVLLLPGVWETWHVLADLAEALHAQGHPVHVVPRLGSNSGTLAEAAGLVSARLAELDLHDVVVVAHSKGGLIAKSALTAPEASRRVAGIVAVATPFAGSAYATWFPSRTIRRLSPRDPFLRALAADVALNSRIAVLRPRQDPHVPRTVDLVGAVNRELPLVGHFIPLGSPVLHAAVLEAVRGFGTRPPTAPGGQDR